MTNYTAPLKFRVWDKKWNRFIDGDDVHIYGSGDFMADRRANPSGDVIETAESSSGDLIIVQSTGLFDKNNKEIFGGDIVKILPGNYMAEVVFEEGSVFAKMDYDVKDFADYQLQRLEDLIEGGEVEVIGNVFENPELVEGEA